MQESGGHRFQRIPFSEKRGRVHSSTVTVAVFLNKPNNFIFSEEDLVVEYYSGQGKGGMNRNKVQACCRIRHIPTGIVKTSQTRSRINSYENALKELKQAVLNQNHQNFSDKNNKVRQNLIGSGERSDKIRTYRFQDNLLIDHVNNKKLPLDSILKDMMVLWRKS